MKDVDPIEELHRIRRAICMEAGGTPADYIRYYMEMSKKRLAKEKAAQKRKNLLSGVATRKNKGNKKSTGRQKSAKGPINA